MDQPSRASCDPLMLPDHLQSMLDLTSEGLDSIQRGQLANTLLQFVDLFPVPGSALTGHTDAVEHTINTGTTTPIRCAPRRMLAGKRWFSTLDLASGYWQVSLSPEVRCKTAFATHSGLFQFRVMPFGLCNAPATFERLMDQVLQGLRWSRCLVYLDDIISFGTTFGDALDNLTLIFERLRTYGLQLKSTKCHLFQTSVPFLGHVVGRRGLECDPKKIEDVKCWPVPDCLKSVRQFL